LHQLTGRQFLVTIRAEGGVSALPMCATTVDDTLSHAVGLELERALEDALQGDEIGGYCFDPETETLEQVAGYALRPQGACS
jgi:hypothetical protein